MSDVQLKQNGSKGAFVYQSEDGSAEMTFSAAGAQLIIIDHTDVGEGLRGQGIGYRLVEAAVNHARGHGIKILPLCPFAKSVFEKHPAYGDVLR